MEAIEIYKFIKDNHIEWHWVEYNNYTDVVIFIPFDLLEKFTSMLSKVDIERRIESVLIQFHVCIMIKELLERHEIELSEIFTESENDF